MARVSWEGSRDSSGASQGGTAAWIALPNTQHPWTLDLGLGHRRCVVGVGVGEGEGEGGGRGRGRPLASNS